MARYHHAPHSRAGIDAQRASNVMPGAGDLDVTPPGLEPPHVGQQIALTFSATALAIRASACGIGVSWV